MKTKVGYWIRLIGVAGFYGSLCGDIIGGILGIVFAGLGGGIWGYVAFHIWGDELN